MSEDRPGRDPDSNRNGDPSGDGPEPPERMRAALVGATGCLGLSMPLVAMVWLWFRDRLEIVSEWAVAPGPWGSWISLGSGLACGLFCYGVVLVTARVLPAYRALEHRLAQEFGPQPEHVLVILSLLWAVGEETLFRLAAQDAVGIGLSLLFCGLLNWMPGLTPWTLLIVCLSAIWALMVHCGLGLLSATTAHAVFNYLTLRRLLPAAPPADPENP